MRRKYYIDTCIWRDYFENRSDHLRPLGEWAYRALRKIIDAKDYIVYSDIVLSELSHAFIEKKVISLLSIVPKDLMIKVYLSKKQAREARLIALQYNIPREDAAHAVLARDSYATLITRDKHFLLIENGPIIKLPEDLL